jgi:quinol monooxygenase YgiN/mannose-6-phosphate isomerase-like protein (cupin superfamily)
MEAVARNVRMVARPGKGEELAERMLAVADALREVPGCLLYLINRASGDPDTIWVNELWRSQEDIDAALASEGAQASMPGVLALVDRERTERIDLDPAGGVGFPTVERGYAIVHLTELEDMAKRFGYSEHGESRFARSGLGATATGLSLQRLHPGRRGAFGHRHQLDEEIYVVLEGSGQIAVDDETAPIGTLDAIRVAPGSTRAFEAGPEGLTLLATGAHHPGDAELVPGFWPE